MTKAFLRLLLAISLFLLLGHGAHGDFFDSGDHCAVCSVLSHQTGHQPNTQIELDFPFLATAPAPFFSQILLTDFEFSHLPYSCGPPTFA